jgi:hypothetical protein
MASEVFKILLFLKRRPGMSVEAFREYYEGIHVKLCEKYAVGAQRYFRRFLQPAPNPDTGVVEELAFDVITEIWLTNRSMFEKVVELTARNVPPPEILLDEERLFDRAKTRCATVIEFESDLPVCPAREQTHPV